jgi:hypothetical protein
MFYCLFIDPCTCVCVRERYVFSSTALSLPLPVILTLSFQDFPGNCLGSWEIGSGHTTLTVLLAVSQYHCQLAVLVAGENGRIELEYITIGRKCINVFVPTRFP